MASLPQPSDLDWEEEVEAKPGVHLGEASHSHSDSLAAAANTLGDEEVFRKKEERMSEVTQPSASEELRQEPIPEQMWQSQTHQILVTLVTIIPPLHTWRD